MKTPQCIAVVKMLNFGGSFGAFASYLSGNPAIPPSLQAVGSMQVQAGDDAFIVLLLSNDAPNASGPNVNEMELLGKLYANPTPLQELQGGNSTPVVSIKPANMPEAAAAFTGGDVQLFRRMIQNLREQNNLA